ncbi:TPA: hypothetical protein ACYQGA_001508, partial [Streptococcus pneumoniae]
AYYQVLKKLDTMRFIVGRFTSFSTEIESFPKIFLYSMKIKVQTRKLAAGCSKHCFEVVDRTDEVSSKHGFEVVDETDEVSNHTYGKATLTWFEEIFEDY